MRPAHLTGRDRATVVLLAHGSPDPRHRAAIEAVATELEPRLDGCGVVTAYLETDVPSPSVLGPDLVGDVVCVPMLVTPAYHARVDVPRAARELGAGGASVRVSDALGPDGLLLDAAAELLLVGGVVPDPGVEVLLVAGGSSSGVARTSLVELVARTPRPGWGAWHGTSLREPRSIAQVRDEATARGHALVTTAFTLAEGVLHDAVARLSEEAGVPFVPGGLYGQPSLVDLVARRAGG